MAIDVSELNPLTTKIQKEETITVSGISKDNWLYVKGNGRVDEFSIKSDKNTLILRLVIDDTEIYKKAISWFITNDAQMYNVDGAAGFIVSIRDIFFKESFTIEYESTETTIINFIMCRYSVRGDSIKT